MCSSLADQRAYDYFCMSLHALMYFAERRRQQEAKARAIANEKKLAKRKAQAIRAGFSAPL